MDEEDGLLLLAEELETQALRKRKMSTHINTKQQEGQYTAALRGSNSQVWQSMVTSSQPNKKPNNSFSTQFSNPTTTSSSLNPPSQQNDGACYKCNQPGHWAKNCPNESLMPQKPCNCGHGNLTVLTSRSSKNPGRKFYKCSEDKGGCGYFQWCDEEQSAPAFAGGNLNCSPGISKNSEVSKQCPCGAGICTILTARTEKNQGRQFYRCPNDTSRCSFFEWCDNDPLQQSPPAIGGRNIYPNSDVPIGGRHIYPNSNVPKGPDISKQCPCGGGPCLVLTSKTEKNLNRQFFRCPKENACKFFEWCDASSQHPALSQQPPVAYGSQAWNSNSDITRGPAPFMACPCGAGPCSVLTARTEKNNGRQFFRCPNPEESSCKFFKWCDSISDTCSTTADNFSSKSDDASSESCFKCGRDGHWARDCPTSSSGTFTSPNHSQGIRSDSQNTCFKCGQVGHWAKNCSVEVSPTSYANKYSSGGKFPSSAYPSRTRLYIHSIIHITSPHYDLMHSEIRWLGLELFA